MLRKQIIATTELDRQNQQIPLEELKALAVSITDNSSVIRMGIGHDATILPIGKVLRGNIIKLDNGKAALETQIDDFISEFQTCKGPSGEELYLGESKVDFRPFVHYGTDDNNEFTVSINPINFAVDDYSEIEQYLKGCNASVESVVQKAAIPEIEIGLKVISGVFAYLLCRKTLNKTTDKLSEQISDDVVKCYEGIRKVIKFIFGKIKGLNNVTYVLSESDQPIELIVCTDNAQTVMEAYDALADGSVADEVERYMNYLNGTIDKIQFLYNVDTAKWELNYIVTVTGQVIGTEKCYKRAVRLYNRIMQSPTAGFSIGGPVTCKKEIGESKNASEDEGCI